MTEHDNINIYVPISMKKAFQKWCIKNHTNMSKELKDAINFRIQKRDNYN